MNDQDRELLEFAAKAAGIEIDNTTRELWKYPNSSAWNPLDRDDDALHLLVKLRLQVFIDGYMVVVRTGNPHKYGAQESLSGCEYAATRRAIVRAAAEIGRNMK